MIKKFVIVNSATNVASLEGLERIEVLIKRDKCRIVKQFE